MQISVNGRQLSVGDALREKIEDRLRVAISKYFSSAIEANVVFTKSKRVIQTDVTIHVGHGITLNAHAQHQDMAASFEAAADKLEKRLRRHKRRLRDHHKNRAGRARTGTPADQYVLAGGTEDDIAEDDAAQTDAPVIVAETRTRIDVLSVGDAVMQLDLAQTTALMFRNPQHGGLNVVYRRPDGNIGWIDPKDSSAPR